MKHACVQHSTICCRFRISHLHYFPNSCQSRKQIPANYGNEILPITEIETILFVIINHLSKLATSIKLMHSHGNRRLCLPPERRHYHLPYPMSPRLTLLLLGFFVLSLLVVPLISLNDALHQRMTHNILLAELYPAYSGNTF